MNEIKVLGSRKNRDKIGYKETKKNFIKRVIKRNRNTMTYNIIE